MSTPSTHLLGRCTTASFQQISKPYQSHSIVRSWKISAVPQPPQVVCSTRSFTLSCSRRQELQRTVLYDLHTSPKYGAKMVPFAGFEMPLSYTSSGGQIKEHVAVRERCGLFDVSHMVQHIFSGSQATQFMERIIPTDVSSLPNMSCSLSVLLNRQGGIVDDCMVTRWGEKEWYIVTNAGRRLEDLNHFKEILEEFPSVQHQVLDGWGLVALQGPHAAAILQPLLTGPTSKHEDSPLNLNESLVFGQACKAHIAHVPVHIARGGYTGEDGFEIALPPDSAKDLTQLLLAQEGVTPCGLAARDSLRLEAGLCLYGHDLDESVGTAEAGLGWVVGKNRTGFLGEERTKNEKGAAIRRRRVGLLVEKGAPARGDAPVLSEEGEQIGKVTSGIPSPSLGKNIAMAYVKTGWHQKGTQVKVRVRGKSRDAEVVKMPFVETRYFRGLK